MTAVEPDRVDEDAGHPATSARTLFRVPFASAMSDGDAQRLQEVLDMTLHLHPKHPAIRPPLGVTPLSFGGLFLVRGEGEDQWALECRAWTDPAPESVRACRLDAVLAARRLDPSVPLPTDGAVVRGGARRSARGHPVRSPTTEGLW